MFVCREETMWEVVGSVVGWGMGMRGRLGPDEAALLQRALAHLMLGNYADGFRDFEARYAGDEVSLPENAPWPRWQGEPLAGRSIVVLPEQGFGDAVLMARVLTQL